jgi:signal transduction histidine kinase/DNA-binding NarL/FixJ family response regulator
MANKRFGYFIIVVFAAATVMLLIIQYNFSVNMDSMLYGNRQLANVLRTSNHLRGVDRDLLRVESRIRAAIATSDTSHLTGIESKIAGVMSYLDSLDADEPGNQHVVPLERLRVLANEKLRIKNELLKRFASEGNMNDTRFIANPYGRRIADEIAGITENIYHNHQSKMEVLNRRIVQGSTQARLYGNVLIAFMFLSGGILCWFIFRQFRSQNRMIIQLDSSEKIAREALQIKENFLANMSHEIRTPLNSILGFTNLLQRRKHDLESAEFVDSIQKAGENLMAIINDILDLSKLEAGMMRIVRAPFSVRGLTHSIETLFKEKIREKGLTLKSTIADDLPDTLIGDATRLTQILVNLIGNALKFSDSGVIEVNLFRHSRSENSLTLGVEVKDNGIGISGEKLEKIFERFNQAEDSITRSYGGSGLGLSIVKTLIDLQNGEISVQSRPGVGTTFTFLIPYNIADEQIIPDPQPDTEAVQGNKAQALHILVVDDNAMNQSLMKHILTQWGASFTLASNGLEAVGELRSRSYDLVLMDIQMPKMDGYAASRFIRNELKIDIPIIAMTAHAMAGEREKCLSNGMNEYISKPIDEELLIEMIGQLVKGKVVGIRPQEQTPSTPAFRVIDISYMKNISKGNLPYERLVTEQFIQTVPEDIKRLYEAFESGDTGRLSSIAHNLKTTVAIMGLLPPLELLLDQLENAQQPDPGLATTIHKIQTVCADALEEAKVFQMSLHQNS